MSEIEPPAAAILTQARLNFHRALLEGGVLSWSRPDVSSIADANSVSSVSYANSITRQLNGKVSDERLVGQTGGAKFEQLVREFLDQTLHQLVGTKWGTFSVANRELITKFAQYLHLGTLAAAAKDNRAIELALSGEYLVAPDVVVSRPRLSTEEVNVEKMLVDDGFALGSTLRSAQAPILHASVSCKLTIRSDRSQNSRLEALNLIRNRRGRVPHIVVVTAEPLPSRIASIAVGTGDFDCIYHVALRELRTAVGDALIDPALSSRSASVKARLDQRKQLDRMIDSGRLKDIADLPLDLLL